MLVAKVDPIAFSTIMNRITKYMEELDSDSDSKSKDKESAKEDKKIIYTSTPP